MHIDELTGLPTKKELDRYIKNYNGESFCIGLIDIDSFIFVNDQYGWSIADKCLAELAEIITKNIQGNNIIAFRIGGDDFLLVDSKCNTDNLANIIQNIQTMVFFRKMPFKGHSNKERDRLSISVAVSENKLNKMDDLNRELGKLDKGIYNLKRKGNVSFNAYYQEK